MRPFSDLQRNRLVDNLLGQKAITSKPIEQAFRKVARHQFLPPPVQNEAYQDRAVPIHTERTPSGGTTCLASSSQPSLMAMMLEALEIESTHEILEIGTGSGYNAALLAEITGRARQIYSVDVSAKIHAAASRRLRRLRYDVHLAQTDGLKPCFDGRLFDRMIVTASTPGIPKAWLAQLSDGGVLVTPYYWNGVDYLLVARKVNQQSFIGHFVCFTQFTGLDHSIRANENTLTIFHHKPVFSLTDVNHYDRLEDPALLGKLVEMIDSSKRWHPQSNRFFSSLQELDGFYIYTKQARGFESRKGLNLAQSFGRRAGFSGYGFYALDTLKLGLVVLPYATYGREMLAWGDSSDLLEDFELLHDEWSALGTPRLEEFELTFTHSDPDSPVRPEDDPDWMHLDVKVHPRRD